MIRSALMDTTGTANKPYSPDHFHTYGRLLGNLCSGYMGNVTIWSDNHYSNVGNRDNSV